MSQRSFFDAETKVVKSNSLVQSRINFTKLEHRVVAMLIAQLRKDDEEFGEQRVYIKDLADLSGRSGKSLYDQAEEICQKLLDQKIHVRTQTEDGRRRYKGYNCMSTCEYVEGSGYITAKFNDDMRPFLLQLKRRFTQYNLQCFMKLSSQHSMRIYELLQMRQGLSYLRIGIDELREILCCEHSYERFADFKRWVLEKAREELKEKTDIYFNYSVERDGQTPVRINFAIKHNGKQQSKEGSQSSSPLGSGDSSEGNSSIPEGSGNHGHAESEDNGSSASNASGPRIDVYGLVLNDLTQDELDRVSDDEIHDAITRARSTVEEVAANDSPGTQAIQVYKRAVEILRK